MNMVILDKMEEIEKDSNLFRDEKLWKLTSFSNFIISNSLVVFSKAIFVHVSIRTILFGPVLKAKHR